MLNRIFSPRVSRLALIGLLPLLCQPSWALPTCIVGGDNSQVAAADGVACANSISIAPPSSNSGMSDGGYNAVNLTNQSSGAITVTGADGFGIYSSGINATLTNSGTITTAATAPDIAYGIRSIGANATISNSGTINLSLGSDGISVGQLSIASGGTVQNSGTINAHPNGSFGNGISLLYYNNIAATNTNTGSIIVDGDGGYGIFSLNATGGTITNAGLIQASNVSSYGGGIWDDGDTNLKITNSGVISVAGTNAQGIQISGLNTILNNSGSIQISGDGSYGVWINGDHAVINNSNAIQTAGANAIGIYFTSNINTINNTGSIHTSGFASQGIYFTGTDATITNSGSIQTAGESAHGIYAAYAYSNAAMINSGTIATAGDYANGIFSFGDGSTINNSGSIATTGFQAAGILSYGTNTAITNSGTIHTTANNSAAIASYGDHAVINNNGSIITLGDDSIFISADGIASYANNAVINNGKTISTSGPNASGIRSLGSDAIITNSGTIAASNSNSHGICNGGSNAIITNLGTTTATGAGSYGIYNVGNITTLTNAQGGSTALTYFGNLPTNYNVVINGSSYGKLAATNIGSSQTTLGIAPGSTPGARKYSGLLSGVSASNLTGATAGTFGGFAYRLVLASDSADTWDLMIPTYVNANNTLTTVRQNADELATVFNRQTAALQTSLSYDCTLYDEQNLCVSGGGRYTYSGSIPSGNEQASLVIVGYRPAQHFRVGAFADQTIANANPGGVTENIHGPMFGFFGNWMANNDGNGFGVQASAAFSASELSITRSSAMAFTEAGHGNTAFDGQGYQIKSSYTQPMTNGMELIRYLGLQYTKLNMEGYSESANSDVNYPLSYGAVHQRNFALIGGVGISSVLADKITGTASAGIQQSLDYSADNYRGSSQLPGLNNFSAHMPGHHTVGATVTAGLFYDVGKHERLGFTVQWQQQPFIATNTTSALATYTIGF